MSYTTIRLRTETRDLLRALAEGQGRSMHAVIEAAVEAYRRRCMLDQVNQGYADPGAAETRKANASERAAWDDTTGDGLDDERGPRAKRPPSGDKKATRRPR